MSGIYYPKKSLLRRDAMFLGCICLGVGEAVLLFLCGLLGLCKLCAKKHLHCKDEHCHDEVDKS